MTVMSSQRFINYENYERILEELSKNEVSKLTLPVINAYIKDLEGNDMYILIDGHHRLKTCRELNIPVEFEEVDDELSYYQDIIDKNGEAICEANHIDSSWYYITNEDEELIGVDVW